MADPSAVLPDLARWLPTQRWYAGSEEPAAVEIAEAEQLLEGGEGRPALTSLVLRADGILWHVPVGWRPRVELPPSVADRDGTVIGEVEGLCAYDAAHDTELTAYLFQIVTRSADPPVHIRPIGAEQSNTSLVCDDETVIKLFRRIEPGENPDVTVPKALTDSGFAHVPPVLGVWRRGELDLGVAQQYLPGSTDGFSLALASVRDCLRTRTVPERAGGDFAGEAARLGQVTGELHVALAEAFGSSEGSAKEWARDLAADVERVGVDAGSMIDRLESVAEPGQVIRAHGDYHLGQVLRTDSGWFILDFEGEPDRRARERERRTSPLRDLAGMLRSLDYAAAVGLAEQTEADQEEVASLARAWVAHNRDSLQGGYTSAEGLEALLPAAADRAVVLAGFELEKAIYELGYERAHRPDWAHIPEAAIARLVGGQKEPDAVPRVDSQEVG